MKEFKGTPGPWEVSEPCCDAVGTEFDSTWYKAICHRPERTGGKLPDEYNANMHLIAAAPELLEALRQLRDYVEDMLAAYEHQWIDESHPMALARAAIAKALGEAE